MGLAVLLSALSVYLVYLLLYLSEVYNEYIFDRVADKLGSAVNSDLEFDYIISTEKGFAGKPQMP